MQRGALVFPRLPDLPYDPYRNRLYTWRELLEGHSVQEDQSLDRRIYEHFREQGRSNPDVREALAERLHDYSIDDALRDLLPTDETGMTHAKVVGVMGGHGVRRDHAHFRQAAQTAHLLARAGYFIATGGGPGIMEAANLGAYLGGEDGAVLEDALRILAQAPAYADRDYFRQARTVLERHPTGLDGLAVPTWFYGHEPSNLFGTHIAKYFSNSLREDGLLALCLHGVVFAPGSAGTWQEVFIDAAQNHYGSLGWVSPMAFLGQEAYRTTGLYPLLERLAEGRTYRGMLGCADEPAEIVAFLKDHPPVRVETT
jgi:putative intracellular protease/amidase